MVISKSSFILWRQKPIVWLRHLHGPRMLQENASLISKKGKLRGDNVDARIPRLIDKDAAEQVARVLKPRLKQKPIFESSPGEGLLSEALLNEGVRNMILWEPQAKYWEQLEDLTHQHVEAELEKRSFFRVKALPKEGPIYLQKKQCPWNKGIQLQVVGIVHPKDISMWMARNAFVMASGAFPYHLGRTNFFLLVSGREHQLMVDQDGAVGGMVGPVPRRIIDYQLYYRISTLLKIHKSAIDGEMEQGRVPKTASWDRDHLYLVELTPRRDLFEAICDKEAFSSFLTFNQQLYRVRRASLIQRLEQWCPGLGLVAIDLGYTMIDTVKQLQAQHLPIIFKELQTRGGLDSLSMGPRHEELHIVESKNTEVEQEEEPVSGIFSADSGFDEEAALIDDTSISLSEKKPEKRRKPSINKSQLTSNEREDSPQGEKTKKRQKTQQSPTADKRVTKKVAWFEAPESELSSEGVASQKSSVSSSVGEPGMALTRSGNDTANMVNVDDTTRRTDSANEHPQEERSPSKENTPMESVEYCMRSNALHKSGIDTSKDAESHHIKIDETIVKHSIEETPEHVNPLKGESLDKPNETVTEDRHTSIGTVHHGIGVKASKLQAIPDFNVEAVELNVKHSTESVMTPEVPVCKKHEQEEASLKKPWWKRLFNS